ncbi:MAG: hypothetical protein V8R89_09890 [Alphaproteobacteria bacterium]
MSIEIINRALIKIGEGTITSLSQNPYGDLMGLVYEDQRKMLLSSHYWRFALNARVWPNWTRKRGRRCLLMLMPCRLIIWS